MLMYVVICEPHDDGSSVYGPFEGPAAHDQATEWTRQAEQTCPFPHAIVLLHDARGTAQEHPHAKAWRFPSNGD